MKLVDSHKQQLDYAQILHTYHSGGKRRDERLDDFTVWMAATAAAISKMNADGAVIGNTFFLSKRGSGDNSHKAMVWAMNADTLQNMVDNVAEGLTRLANDGVQDVVAMYKSPAISRVLKQAFNKIKSDDDSISFTKTAKGLIVMQMKLEGGENV